MSVSSGDPETSLEGKVKLLVGVASGLETEIKVFRDRVKVKR